MNPKISIIPVILENTRPVDDFFMLEEDKRQADRKSFNDQIDSIPPGTAIGTSITGFDGFLVNMDHLRKLNQQYSHLDFLLIFRDEYMRLLGFETTLTSDKLTELLTDHWLNLEKKVIGLTVVFKDLCDQDCADEAIISLRAILASIKRGRVVSAAIRGHAVVDGRFGKGS